MGLKKNQSGSRSGPGFIKNLARTQTRTRTQPGNYEITKKPPIYIPITNPNLIHASLISTAAHTSLLNLTPSFQLTPCLHTFTASQKHTASLTLSHNHSYTAHGLTRYCLCLSQSHASSFSCFTAASNHYSQKAKGAFFFFISQSFAIWVLFDQFSTICYYSCFD